MNDQYLTVHISDWNESYLDLICGIANAGGGSLMIDSFNKNQSKGLRRMRKSFESIPSLTYQELGITCIAEPVFEGSQLCLEISIPPAEYPVSYQGRYYLYTDGENKLLSGEALDRFLSDEDDTPWDMRLQPFARRDEIDTDIVFGMYEAINEEVPEDYRLKDRDIEHVIDEYDLKDRHTDALTNAGVLLLTHDPEQYIPGAQIRVGFFDTGNRMTDSLLIRGSIISQLQEMLDLLYEDYFPNLVHDSFNEIIPPPEFAVEEALVNAIVHKDYASGMPINVSIYPDRLFVENVGRPPEGWTLDDLLGKHSSRPNNLKLAKALHMGNLFDGWGNGISLIEKECRNAHTPAPIFHMHADEMSVEFPYGRTAEDVEDDGSTPETTTEERHIAPAEGRSSAPKHARKDADASMHIEQDSEVLPSAESIEPKRTSDQEDDKPGLSDHQNAYGKPLSPLSDKAEEQGSGDSGIQRAEEPEEPEEQSTRIVRPAPSGTGKQSTKFNERSIAAANRLDLTSTDEYVLKALETNGRATAIRIAEVLGVSESTVRRSFKKLRDLKMIERIGSDKAGYWRVLI